MTSATERTEIRRRHADDRASIAAERARIADFLEHAAAHGLQYEVQLLRLRYAYDLAVQEVVCVVDPGCSEVAIRRQPSRAIEKIRRMV